MKQDKKQNPMDELISLPDTGMGDTTDSLARLWRNILSANVLKPSDWNRKVVEYITSNQKVLSRSQLNDVRTNVTRRLADPKVSWDLVLKGIKILGYVKITIKLELEKPSGRVDDFKLKIIDTGGAKNDQ